MMKELKNSFRPEFLNRVDDTIIFNSLPEAHLTAIVGIQLKSVIARLQNKGIELEFTDSALSYLAKKGFDPIYGARPLKRVIQKEVVDHLAKELIAGNLKEGSKVKVDADDLRLSFN